MIISVCWCSANAPLISHLEHFAEVCDDILIYFGFPALDPAHDNFERLLMDVYTETLDDHPNVSNTRFQELYLQNLRKYLRTIAHA